MPYFVKIWAVHQNKNGVGARGYHPHKARLDNYLEILYYNLYNMSGRKTWIA